MLHAIHDVLCEESENKSFQSNEQKGGIPARACINHPDKPCCGGCANCRCTLTSESEKDNPTAE